MDQETRVYDIYQLVKTVHALFSHSCIGPEVCMSSLENKVMGRRVSTTLFVFPTAPQ